MYSPLDQFIIATIIPVRIGFLDLTITNSTIAMLIAVGMFIIATRIILSEGYIIPTLWQNIIEIIYEFIHNIVIEQIGVIGAVYFPIILTLFIYILTNNLLGLIPYVFTPTSHLIVTLGMSFTVFFGVTILGFMIHGIRYLNILKPTGVSKILIPLIVAIESVSYCMRAISLGVRLAANMLAGHALLHIISGFTWQFLIHPSVIIKIVTIIPFVILVALTGLELIIAFLQSYVFTVLTCSYINDAINMH